MERRELIIGVGASLSGIIAGCIGSSEPDKPDPETPTSDLLPDTDEWPLEEEHEQMATMVGGNDGVQGNWEGPDGSGYTMEILRFSEEDSAEEAVDVVYGDWFLSLSHGVFTFAVNGEQGEHARNLLAASPALNQDIVESKT